MKIFGQKKYTIVLVPYTGFTPIWSAFSRLGALIKWAYHKTLGLYLVNSVVSGVRAISEWEVLKLKDANVKIRIEVIKCGIEDEAFGDIESNASAGIKDLVKQTGPYMIQIGRIHKLKNCEAAIRTISQVSGLKMVFVGPDQDADYKQYLLRLAKDLDVADSVIFTDVISIPDKFYLLKHAAIAFHPSLYEGFGIAVYEAMSQGCVCVVSNNTAVDELVKEGVNGYLVGPFDYSGFADRVKYILDPSNKPEIAKIRQNNLDFTRGATWTNISKQVQKFYLSLLN